MLVVAERFAKCVGRIGIDGDERAVVVEEEECKRSSSSCLRATPLHDVFGAHAVGKRGCVLYERVDLRQRCFDLRRAWCANRRCDC